MKTNIGKILILLFIQCLFFPVFAQEEQIKEAESAYAKEDYSKAISIYEDLLKTYGNSAEIYYNLGNAYYKTNQIASAILNYERALLMNPGDGDVRFNIELAKQKTTDKIEPVDEFIFAKWFKSIQNLVSADTWATIGIICFLSFIGCLILFFFSKWMRLKKVGFYLGIAFILLTVFANVFGANQKKALSERRGAIIFTPTVTVKSSPDASGTDLFILHEGTKVFIKSSLGEWKEIELEDGNIGWIPKKDVVII
ncbi:tetratricopeptide repeat protein [Parabacteroides sp. Marseille-P3160]|uniref:tetratricopeptide repeat protein n=1 Tax=Parabacteroides sp. Marseille-P3160 TaxID=1917887 RepID=UPI0009BC3992|nr:tetratricopeptide repeat protein [Parabacteroides sp. Marseille-P3160]